MTVGSAPDTAVAPKTVLRVGMESPVHTWDPRAAQDLVSALVVRQVFDTPFCLSADGNSVEGRILETPLVQKSAHIYSTTLRPGIFFSDGTPVDTAAVVESLNAAEALKPHARVTREGDRIFLTLERPNYRFDLVLTQTFCSVVRRKAGELLGTGPYRLANASGGDTVRLVRNPYYQGPVGFDEIRFTAYPPAPGRGNEALLQAIERGEVDFTTAVSRQEAEKLRRVRALIEPGSSTAILFFNTERIPDPTVRKAMALAINRSEIAGAFYSNSLAFTATSLLPRIMGGVPDGIPYDLSQALVQLSRPGVRRPERLRLLLIWGPRPYLPEPKAAAQWIVRYLARLGIEVEVVAPTSSSEYFQRAAEGDYDLLLAGWIADTPDPAEFLEANLLSRLIPAPGKEPVSSTNHCRWNHAGTDQALLRYRESPSQVSKMEILGLVAEEVPLFPLMYGPTIFVHSRRVANFRPCGFGIQSLALLKPATT